MYAVRILHTSDGHSTGNSTVSQYLPGRTCSINSDTNMEVFQMQYSNVALARTRTTIQPPHIDMRNPQSHLIGPLATWPYQNLGLALPVQRR
jgi:hypothetical protein